MTLMSSSHAVARLIGVFLGVRDARDARHVALADGCWRVLASGAAPHLALEHGIGAAAAVDVHRVLGTDVREDLRFV